MDAYRTPDERFESLPGFDYEPRYREVDGLRLAHIDEGDGEPVVFVHGEPTWSYLWRKVIGTVREAGYRCCLSAYGGSVGPRENLFDLKRIAVSPWYRTPAQLGYEALSAR